MHRLSGRSAENTAALDTNAQLRPRQDGVEAAKTASDFTSSLTGLSSGASTFDSGVFIVGSTVASGTHPTIRNTAADSYVRVSTASISLVMASSLRITIAVGAEPGDVIGFVGQDGNYSLYHNGVKATDAGSFGNLIVTNGLYFTGQSFTALMLFPDTLLTDAAMFSLLANPWQVFEPRARRFLEVGSFSATSNVSRIYYDMLCQSSI
jgi:hypothetical protein